MLQVYFFCVLVPTTNKQIKKCKYKMQQINKHNTTKCNQQRYKNSIEPVKELRCFWYYFEEQKRWTVSVYEYVFMLIECGLWHNLQFGVHWSRWLPRLKFDFWNMMKYGLGMQMYALQVRWVRWVFYSSSALAPHIQLFWSMETCILA